MPTELHQPRDVRSDLAVLYLHGGAYVLGSGRAYRHLVSRLAAALGAPVWVPDYRLAPEHPFPAALDDALAAYTAVAAAEPNPIAIVGDSAGGGLALAVARTAVRRGFRPRLFWGLICPWVDLTVDAARHRQGGTRDPMITRRFLEAGAQAYAADRSRDDPQISPISGDLSALPPVVIDLCSDDLIVDDGRRLARGIEAAGGVVDSHEYVGMWHVFHLMAGLLPAADGAVVALGGRIDRLAAHNVESTVKDPRPEEMPK